MGMSTHVVGFKPPDEKWKKMKAVWEACEKAKIDPPAAVEEFFGGESPDDAGVELSEEALGAAIEEYSDDSHQGYTIYLDKLPRDVKIVRVYNSW